MFHLLAGSPSASCLILSETHSEQNSNGAVKTTASARKARAFITSTALCLVALLAAPPRRKPSLQGGIRCRR